MLIKIDKYQMTDNNEQIKSHIRDKKIFCSNHIGLRKELLKK